MYLEDKRRIASLVSHDEILSWTFDMVSIPSYSGFPMQEKGVAEYIHDLFKRESIETWIDDIGNGHFNVYARICGSENGPSLMLNGHMDTVPAYDMENAFLPYMKNGMLHGRGTSDMKGPLASMMGALIAIRRSGVALKGDLLFVAVAGEEEGSPGAIDLLEKKMYADAVIVGEPMGRSTIAITQKGLEWFEFVVHGKTVHGGSQEEGINAILKANRLINVLQDRLAPALKERKHPLMGSSTMNIGVINGGTQLSTVPGECIVKMDRRFLPQIETYESMVAELEGIVEDLSRKDPDFHCTLKVSDPSIMNKGYVHQGMIQREDSLLVRLLKKNLEEVSGKPASLLGATCWTDAGLLDYYGKMPSVVYGPGDLTKAHSKEESIDPDALKESQCVYVSMALDFCGYKK
ncbi:MAG: M20 family peptidase [Clostridia bacterium]|nr:M20 family peptidase [Clostridia bacterium]